MGRGLGLAELGNKAELDQLGLELWLNWSLEDFPGGWGMGQNWKYSSAQLGPELGNILLSLCLDYNLMFRDCDP